MVVKNSVSWDISHCISLKIDRRSILESNSKPGRGPIADYFTLVSFLAYCSTAKIEAAYFSETPVDFLRTTHRYIPKERTVHNHRCENLKLLDRPVVP
jgi:hypothetical protein